MAAGLEGDWAPSGSDSLSPGHWLSLTSVQRLPLWPHVTWEGEQVESAAASSYLSFFHP